MLLSLFLASAWASSPYPGVLESELGMPCAPTCTVCHESNSGGGGTVTRDFGMALMAHGLSGMGHTATLTAALDTMATDAVDSDGDGTTDLDELVEGSDPNPDAEPFCNVVVPEYGCFGGQAAGVGFGALLGLGALRRRRRTTPANQAPRDS
ncbi:MAG: hypothetical protein Q8P41_21510 [Pseudomonadota bacterium]|nr:hypothetical protein [Pseudomonadota bacterium]